MIITTGHYTVYFGNKTNRIFPGKYNDSYKALNQIAKQLKVQSLTILKQMHGTQSCKVEPGPPVELFKRSGDILISNHPGCALGVLTADCLPIILYDQANHAVAIVHAGWKGTVAGIAQKAVLLMCEQFKTDPTDLIVLFGPSAQACCYEVDNCFYNHVASNYHSHSFFQRAGKILFDNSKLNYLQLLEMGVFEKNIDRHCNKCTICDESYHSYRRDGKKYGLQATIVVLT